MGNTILAGLPSSPAFTEANVPSLTGRVFVVKGASSGVEDQAASILYSKQAKVYIAARSETKCLAAIERINFHATDSKGNSMYLHSDLTDLSTIKASAREFLTKEKRLDVFFNNAGVMLGPKGEGSKIAQGYEIQLGTNCVGPFLFPKLLQSILYHTARIAPTDSVRTVWVSSDSIKNYNPPNGIDISNLDYHTDKSGAMKYGISMAGNMFHASEFASQSVEKGKNIISVSPNPGALKSDLTRSVPSYLLVLTSWMLKPPIFGAYTEVFAAFSLEVNQSRNGRHIVPWGR